MPEERKPVDQLKRRRVRWVLFACVLVLVFAGALSRRPDQPRGLPADLETDSRKVAEASTATEVIEARPGKRAEDTGSLLSDARSALSGAGSAEDAARILEQLRARLEALPRAEAVSLIQAFLQEGTDVPTGIAFSIQRGGMISGAPTFRVFLLDQLARIDPDAGAEFARSILATSSSSDEWAVAMRDFAKVKKDDADRAFIESKLREMIGRSDWQGSPSAGYLEAFDTIVYLGGTQFADELTGLVRAKDNRAVAHAAFLTLDRLVIQDPPALLSKLQQDPELMRGREKTRANYFARADVRDPEQRAVLEQYLLDPRRTPEELQTFSGLYPNANFMISNNLLTETVTPGQGHLVQHDREALAVVGSWLEDPRFASIRPHLEQMHSRLSTFVIQAARVEAGPSGAVQLTK